MCFAQFLHVDGFWKSRHRLGLGPRIDIINEYLDASIEEVESLIQQLNDNEEANWDELNKLFLQTLEIEALSTLDF